MVSVDDLATQVWYLSSPKSRSMCYRNLLLLQQWLTAIRHIAGEFFTS